MLIILAMNRPCQFCQLKKEVYQCKIRNTLSLKCDFGNKNFKGNEATGMGEAGIANVCMIAFIHIWQGRRVQPGCDPAPLPDRALYLLP